METLAPPLQLTLQLRAGLEAGKSLRSCLTDYFQKKDDEMSRLVATWLSVRDQGGSVEGLLSKVQSPYRRALFFLMERALNGEGILPQLQLIEDELKEAAELEMDAFISLLPTRMLIPLLFFQFPAFLLLLFGPLLNDFLKSF